MNMCGGMRHHVLGSPRTYCSLIFMAPNTVSVPHKFHLTTFIIAQRLSPNPLYFINIRAHHIIVYWLKPPPVDRSRRRLIALYYCGGVSKSRQSLCYFQNTQKASKCNARPVRQRNEGNGQMYAPSAPRLEPIQLFIGDLAFPCCVHDRTRPSVEMFGGCRWPKRQTPPSILPKSYLFIYNFSVRLEVVVPFLVGSNAVRLQPRVLPGSYLNATTQLMVIAAAVSINRKQKGQKTQRRCR